MLDDILVKYEIFWISSGRCGHLRDNNNTFESINTVIIIIPYGGINSRMPSYLKISVLIDFPFEILSYYLLV